MATVISLRRSSGVTIEIISRTSFRFRQYHLNDEPCYHVDFAVYGHETYQSENIYLARGKPTSQSEDRYWQRDDPKALMKNIGDRFSNEDDRGQFRRSVRYLKRWKDYNFSPEGHAAPVGIGLTVAAYNWFLPSRILVDPLQNKYKYLDLQALRSLIGEIISHFAIVLHDNEWAERLVVNVLVQPYCDLFEKMSNVQMVDFKAKLSALQNALDEAEKEADPVIACNKLVKQLGDDFPVPEIKETAQARGPAIISSGNSA